MWNFPVILIAGNVLIRAVMNHKIIKAGACSETGGYRNCAIFHSLISCNSLIRALISNSSPDLTRRFTGLGTKHKIWVADSTGQLPRRSPYSLKSRDLPGE